MNASELEAHREDLLSYCLERLQAKAAEHVHDDYLHIFKIAGKLQSARPEVGLGGMMSESIINIYAMINETDKGLVHDEDIWKENIADTINFLTMLWALIHEMDQSGPTFGELPDVEFSSEGDYSLDNVVD